MQDRTATLILENGDRFTGKAFGDIHEVTGEVVFTTNMTGYQETLTDPSFCGQMVVMTYPLIGNYGINFEDMEADKPALSALIVREDCDYPNNFRTEMELGGFLRQNHIMGLADIDTRALTRRIREHGCMRGLLTTQALSDEEAQQKICALDNSDVIQRVSTRHAYTLAGGGKRVAFLDMGAKAGILRELKARDCEIHVLPYQTSAEDIKKIQPDLIFVSNGPGDPMDVPETVETLRSLIGSYKICGICMGHQLIGLALGAKTEKLKFGHHGGNHPVKNLETGQVFISSQNHNYILSDLPADVQPWYVHVNDGTCEGIRHKTLPICSVQFHPEAAPGPHDTQSLFDTFLQL